MLLCFYIQPVMMLALNWFSINFTITVILTGRLYVQHILAPSEPTGQIISIYN